MSPRKNASGTLSKSARKTSAQRRPTILDVASAAGVSKSTVSRVLQDSQLIDPVTRQAVLMAIQQTGYVYNRNAAGLRSPKSSIIGIIVGDLTNPFYAELTVGVQDVLRSKGILPLLANTNEDLGVQAESIRAMREHGAAGIIISPVHGTDLEIIKSTIPNGFPTVIALHSVDGARLPFVGQNNFEGAKLAVQHLVELGHKHIVFVGGDSSFPAQRERVAGWAHASEKAGLKHAEALILNTPSSRAGGASAAKSILALVPRPTAVMCYNDVVALGLSAALADGGVVVGDDISLVGFDDIIEASHANPPLTTVHVDTQELGEIAAQRLLDLIEGKSPQGKPHLGEARLVVRASTGKPKIQFTP